MKDDSFFREIGDAIARSRTGDPNARCFTFSDDCKELYEYIKPKLKEGLLQGRITSKEKNAIWDSCCKLFKKRRKLFTTKTKSIWDEYTGPDIDIHFD